MLETPKVKVNDYLEYEKMEGVNYILPGGGNVNMSIDTGNYYQTEETDIIISGSLSSVKMLTEDDLIYGKIYL